MTVLISTLGCNVAFAQFYDDEDELYFYDCENERSNVAYVFNFDGKRAVVLNSPSTRLKVKNSLLKDINCFEKKVFSMDYNVKYDPERSSYDKTVYYKRGYNQWTNTSYTSYYIFSADRETMYYYEGNKLYYTCHRVDKSHFLPGRKRSNINDDVIYE